MGVVGCILGFLVVIYLCYKDWSVYIASIVGAAVVIAFNVLPFMDTLLDSYVNGMFVPIKSFFFLLLFGSIQSKIYSESGAAFSIADTIMSKLLRPGASNTETVVVNEGSILPRIFPSTQFNYGILVALFCVVVVTWMLYKTPFGFSLRAMGSNPRAMQQAGLPIYGRTIAAMCISGGLFALGGSIQCLAVYKRFVMGFSPGYGWDGITVATLAMNSPVGVLLSAFLFGMLRSASISMSLTSQVTTEMISVLQGFIVMLVASPDVWNVLGHLWQRLKSCVGRDRKQEGAAE